MKLNLTKRIEQPISLIDEQDHGYAAFDNNAYQSRKDNNFISYSRLKSYAVSPAMGLLRDEEKVERTDAMKFGSLVHNLALTPEKQNYIVEEKQVALKKDGTPYANGQQSAEQKARWDELASQGIDVFSPEEFERAQAMAQSAITCINEEFPNFEWDAERTYWRKLDGYTLLCTYDLLNSEKRIALDVKTINDANLDDRTLRKHIFSYWYHGQAGWYDTLFQAKEPECLDYFGFVFVSKSAPYHAKLFLLDRGDIETSIKASDNAVENLLKAKEGNVSTTLEHTIGLYNN